MLQRNILFQPDTRRPDPVRSRSADMIRVTAATADGLELEGWWSPPSGGRRTILYFHGNGWNIGGRDGKARRLIDRKSEEHTSETQSLMRILYAAFLLKNKIT